MQTKEMGPRNETEKPHAAHTLWEPRGPVWLPSMVPRCQRPPGPMAAAPAWTGVQRPLKQGARKGGWVGVWGPPSPTDGVHSASTSLDAQLLPIGLAYSDSGGGLWGWGEAGFGGSGDPRGPWHHCTGERAELAGAPQAPYCPILGVRAGWKLRQSAPREGVRSISPPRLAVAVWPAGLAGGFGEPRTGHSFRVCRGDGGRASRALTAPSRPTRAWVGSGSLPSQVPRWSRRPRR